MILFTIKLISSIRKAIAGRRHPSQLAWGVAFGVLLGLIPHGNLLAVVLVLGVLMLQINHAMVALVGIGLTFFAPRFDPQFDALGRWFFDHPEASKAMASAWQYPLVPWTDLNNTVVMGSFLIGLALLLPIFVLTRPIFKRWAMALEEATDEELAAAEDKVSRVKQELKSSDPNEESLDIRLDSGHANFRPHSAPVDAPITDAGSISSVTASSGRVYDVRRIDPGQADSSERKTVSGPVRVNQTARTRVAIQPSHADTSNGETLNTPQKSPASSKSASDPSTVMMNPKDASETNNSKIEVEAGVGSADDQQKIDEALSYLLRQLRDSKDKDAA